MSCARLAIGLVAVRCWGQGDRVILELARARWSQRFLDLAGSAPDFPYPEEPPTADA